MVGLRWWSEVRDDGSTDWKYECRDGERRTPHPHATARPRPEIARQHSDSQTRNTGSQGIGVFTSLVRDVAMLPHYPRD